MAPFSPETAALRAGRTLLGEIRSFARRRVSFAFETTLSGRRYLTLLRKLKTEGYDIHFFFLWLRSVDLALSRVKERVSRGSVVAFERDETTRIIDRTTYTALVKRYGRT